MIPFPRVVYVGRSKYGLENKNNGGNEIRHDRIYIGFVNYSELYGDWVATFYPDRFSIFSIAEHCCEFTDAVQFIVNQYLNPNSQLEIRELTTK